MNDAEAKLAVARDQFRYGPAEFWEELAEKNQQNTDKALALIRELRSRISEAGAILQKIYLTSYANNDVSMAAVKNALDVLEGK